MPWWGWVIIAVLGTTVVTLTGFIVGFMRALWKMWY